jgi:hypothetical protein
VKRRPLSGGFALAKIKADKMREVLTEHLPYEVQMMRTARELLGTRIQDQWFYNIVHESFFLHARNLIEALQGDNDFKPKEICEKWSRPPFIRNMMEKINQQIQHIAAHRTIVHDNKLKFDEVTRVAQWIEDELQSLEAKLKDEWRDYYKVTAAPGVVVSVTGAATATNSIISAGSTFPADENAKPATATVEKSNAT